MSGYAAARKAGYSENYARHRLHKLSKVVDFPTLAEMAGITDRFLTDYIVERLQAKKIISANIIITKSNDPTVNEQIAHSRTQDFIEVPDYQTQHKFLMTLLLLMKKIETPKGITNINKIDISNTNGKLTDEDRQQQRELLKRIHERYFSNGKLH